MVISKKNEFQSQHKHAHEIINNHVACKKFRRTLCLKLNPNGKGIGKTIQKHADVTDVANIITSFSARLYYSREN